MAYVTIGSDLTGVQASPYTSKDGTQNVIVRGHTGNYPLASIHLSPEEAYKLAAELTAAANSFKAVAV